MCSPIVTVAVVVTYRRPDVVRETLTALLDQPCLTAVVLVDNGGDLTLPDDLARDPRIDLLTSAVNDGFGAGLATGMEAARDRYNPDYYWLMDDDSAPRPGALDESLTVARLLVHPGGINTRAGSYRHGRLRHLPEFASGPPREVDWTLVDGALVSREAVEAAGMPRRDLFMMLEDFEYTTRIARAGLTNYQRAGRVVQPRHLGSQSDWRHYYQARNLLRIAIERRSGWGVIGWFARELRIQSMLLLRRRFGVIPLRWRGAVDGARGRMGRTITPG